MFMSQRSFLLDFGHLLQLWCTAIFKTKISEKENKVICFFTDKPSLSKYLNLHFTQEKARVSHFLAPWSPHSSINGRLPFMRETWRQAHLNIDRRVWTPLRQQSPDFEHDGVCMKLVLGSLLNYKSVSVSVCC